MTDTLHERGKALEDMFFAERDRKLINALRDAAAKEQAAVDIGNITGVSDTSVLQTIAGLGVTSETLAAFSLVPLLHVAWSDKVLDSSERDAILVEAVAGGVFRGSAAYSLLEGWLTRAPEPKLFDTWKAYHQALMPKLSESDRAQLKADLIEKARRIARASGGLFGLGSVSADEREALRKLEELLA
jgi:hypothetical protein